MKVKKNLPTDNAGFSLIEMLITVAILSVLIGLVFLGTGLSRRKETDRFSRELCNQIRLTRTVAMSKSGYWRLCLYLNDGDYYCVQEKGTKDETGVLSWEARSERITLGHEGGVTYTYYKEAGEAAGLEDSYPEVTESGDSGQRICEWRFDRDTGACVKGAGILEIAGPGKTKNLTVYRENGYCQES